LQGDLQVSFDLPPCISHLRLCTYMRKAAAFRNGITQVLSA
jgi:hypothetical protein